MSDQPVSLEDRVDQLEAIVRVLTPDWRTCHTCSEDIITTESACHALLRAAYFGTEPPLDPEPMLPEGPDGPEGD